MKHTVNSCDSNSIYKNYSNYKNYNYYRNYKHYNNYLLQTFFLLLTFFPYQHLFAQAQPPVSLNTLRDIAKSVQDMNDMANVVTVAQLIEDELQQLDVKRLSASDTEWTYGKNMELTTFEDTGIYFYDFLDDDAFAITVTTYNSVTAEVTFRKKEWVEVYMQQAKDMGFVKPQYSTSVLNRWIQRGGLDDIRVELNYDDQIYTVVYSANYYSEPMLLSSADAVTFFFKGIGEVHELLESRGYGLQNAKQQGARVVETYVKGCTRETDSVGKPVIKPLEEPTDLCSAVVITRAADGLVEVELNNLNSFEEDFVDGLIRTGLLPIDNSDEYLANLPREYVSQSGIRAILYKTDNLWRVVITR